VVEVQQQLLQVWLQQHFEQIQVDLLDNLQVFVV
jgi:hypothetical protein